MMYDYFCWNLLLIAFTVIGKSLIDTEENQAYRFMLKCLMAIGYSLVIIIVWSEFLLVCEPEV
jgi:hypothetical protein